MIKTYIDGVLQGFANATNHEDLTNILQAGTGVTNGHISDGTQTIYGAKTFNTPIVSTTASLTNSTNKNLVTDAEKTAITHSNRTALDLVSGSNTGDETQGTIETKLAGSTTVTLQGNTFNGNSQLVQTDATGKLPAIDGSQLTNLPSGETSTMANVGDGEGTVYKTKTGTEFKIKTIKAGTNVSITNNTDDITITATGGSGDFATLTGSEVLTNKTLTSPIINTTATGTAITTTGEASKIMKLGTNGEAKAQSFQVTALNTAPASPTATGTTGEVRVASNGIYYCVATNTWRKALPVIVYTETITGLTSDFTDSTLPCVESTFKYQWHIISGGNQVTIESTHNLYDGSNIYSLVTGATVQTVGANYAFSVKIGSSVLIILFDIGTGAVSYRRASGTITEITVNRLQYGMSW